MAPDPSQWRASTNYDYFDDLGISDLAWECLRRNVDYQRDYAKALKEMDNPEQATASPSPRSPWLGHLMVSRSETARPLLTPREVMQLPPADEIIMVAGTPPIRETARPLLTPREVMQLPPADEIIMVAGTPPIRAKKARYFEDRRFQERILPPPELTKQTMAKADDWSSLALPARPEIEDAAAKDGQSDDEDPTGSERRHQPELNKAGTVEKKAPIDNEFAADFGDDEEDDSARMSRMNQVMQGVARQVSLEPNDGMDL